MIVVRAVVCIFGYHCLLQWLMLSFSCDTSNQPVAWSPLSLSSLINSTSQFCKHLQESTKEATKEATFKIMQLGGPWATVRVTGGWWRAKRADERLTPYNQLDKSTDEQLLIFHIVAWVWLPHKCDKFTAYLVGIDFSRCLDSIVRCLLGLS